MKRIEISVGNTKARLRLLEEVAPKTVAALWETLPVTERFTHARWAGPACWLKVDKAPLVEHRELESPVTSIYKGTLVMRPNRVGPAEIYLSYGQAEARHERGRTPVTPVAQIEGDATALYELMASTWRNGSTEITIARV